MSPKYSLFPFCGPKPNQKGTCILDTCLVKSANFYTRKQRKKAPKSFENHPKIDVWDSLGTFLESFYKHLGHMSPKDWIFKAFGNLGSPRQPTWLQLGGPKAPKSSPKPEKIDVEKQYIFGIDFGRVQTSFWKSFW